MSEVAKISKTQELLFSHLDRVRKSIGEIKIGSPEQFPYGWRKAAKGRTVWRILEECLNQKLETSNTGESIFTPADSEVGVFDFHANFASENCEGFVNIKSATKGRKNSKDDLSKAIRLIEFYQQNPNAHIFIATFEIEFLDDMKIALPSCYVMPLAWIPDVYVNPSNNGNLQSAKYKDLDLAVKRTNQEFYDELVKANEVAIQKKRKKS
ncbi:MAG: hypothetical protein H6624_12785 [Bdellovibrionaceae bacterium]|nr:hypothetical protein [Pseudobdellovibrionaceae bacterium]